MNRLLLGTAVAVLLGLSPALAADDNAMQTPTQPGVSSGAAKAATQPQSGSADTSGGAAEQSSAPPSSGAVTGDHNMEAMKPSSGSADTSGGAQEQSSAPAGSSAADSSKPNPTLGHESSKE